VLNRDTPDELVFLREAWEKVQSSLADLYEGQKLVYLLAYREEFTSKEIAQILGLSVASVKSRLHRARHFLRNALNIELGNE
jgi:RNA polymerase sigma-70 factor (ECF subfamily)